MARVDIGLLDASPAGARCDECGAALVLGEVRESRDTGMLLCGDCHCDMIRQGTESRDPDDDDGDDDDLPLNVTRREKDFTQDELDSLDGW